MIRFEEIDARERLKEYIERDEIYEDYKQDKLMNPSDFEIFCIQHCKDIEEILEENQELKKQLEYYRKLGFKHLQDKNNNLEAQQKEFIKWLENYLELFDYDNINYDMIEEILQKYKEIIGGKE